MRDFRFLQPDDLSAVLKAKQDERENGRILAGGTNLLSYIKLGRVKEGLLIDITRLKELKQIEEKAEHITFGASLTIQDLIESPVLRKRLPGFFESLQLFGNPLIRAKATLGGNIADASPIADTAPILLVLDAVVNIASSRGERTVELARFFTGVGKTVLEPDEVLTSIKVPVHAESRTKMLKLGLRKGTACSVTSTAVRLEMADGTIQDLRVAMGGVAPTPLRAYSVEQALTGKRFSVDEIETHASLLRQDISPISDVRGTAEYRREVSVKLLKRALKTAAGMEV